MVRDEYPALWQLLGGYLHQDWAEEYGTVDAAVRDFASGEPALAPQLADEVDSVLRSRPTDSDVEDLIRAAGSAYVPSRHGEGARAWLQHISEIVTVRGRG